MSSNIHIPLEDWLNRDDYGDDLSAPKVNFHKNWERKVSIQHVDGIERTFLNGGDKIITQSNGTQFCVIDPENGDIDQKIALNFNEKWNDDIHKFEKYGPLEIEWMNRSKLALLQSQCTKDFGMISQIEYPAESQFKEQNPFSYPIRIVYRAVYNPNAAEMLLFNIGAEHNIQFIDTDTRNVKRTLTLPIQNHGGVTAIKVLTNQNHCLIACNNACIYHFDLDSNQFVQTYSGNALPVSSIEVNDTESQMITCQDNKNFQVWNLSNGELIYDSKTFASPLDSTQTTNGILAEIDSLLWNSSLNELLIGYENGVLQSWYLNIATL